MFLLLGVVEWIHSALRLVRRMNAVQLCYTALSIFAQEYRCGCIGLLFSLCVRKPIPMHQEKNTQNQQQYVAFVERTHWHRSPVFAWKTSFVCLCGCEFTHWANDLLASSVAWNIIALSVAHIPNRCVYAPTERNGIECGRFCVRRDKNVLMEAWFVCMFSAYTAFLLVLVAPHTCKLRRKLTRSNNNQPKKQQKLVWKRVQPTKRIRLIHSKRYRR